MVRSTRGVKEVHYVIEGPNKPIGDANIYPMSVNGFFCSPGMSEETYRFSEVEAAQALGFAFRNHDGWPIEALSRIRLVKVTPPVPSVEMREIVVGR